MVERKPPPPPLSAAGPPVRVLYSVPVATMTRVHAGFTGVVQRELAAAARLGAPRAARRCRLDTLPGVGAALAKQLRALGLETVGDLLLRRPRRYERAADEVAISQLWGDEEVVIAGVVQDVRSRRLGGRRTIVTARDQGRERLDLGLVVQPAVARRQADARDAPAAARQARPLRLRRQDATTSARRARPPTSRRSTARASRCRRGGCASSSAPRSREHAPRRARPAARRARAAAAARRARGAPLPARRGGGRGGAAAARARRAVHAAARGRCARATRTRSRRALGEPGELVGALPRARCRSR